MGPKSDLKNTYIIPTLPKSSFSRNEKEDQETKGKLTPTPENDSTRADGTLSNVNSCETPFSVTINEVAVDKNEKATLDELERSKVSEDKDHLLADQQVSSVTSSRCPGDEVVEANYSKIKQDINASLPDTDQGHTDQEVSPKVNIHFIKTLIRRKYHNLQKRVVLPLKISPFSETLITVFWLSWGSVDKGPIIGEGRDSLKLHRD